MATVYLGLGSNLGDRERNLSEALRQLQRAAEIDAVSSLYETEPVGPHDQPPYLNAVCCGRTNLEPQELLRELAAVEHDLGRRGAAHERWGPRPIDIDLLLYDDAIIDEPGLHVPHAELTNRAFVLVPLAEIAPDLAHPKLGKSIRALADAIDRSGVALRSDRGWQAAWPQGQELR